MPVGLGAGAAAVADLRQDRVQIVDRLFFLSHGPGDEVAARGMCAERLFIDANQEAHGLAKVAVADILRVDQIVAREDRRPRRGVLDPGEAL